VPLYYSSNNSLYFIKKLVSPLIEMMPLRVKVRFSLLLICSRQPVVLFNYVRPVIAFQQLSTCLQLIAVSSNYRESAVKVSSNNFVFFLGCSFNLASAIFEVNQFNGRELRHSFDGMHYIQSHQDHSFVSTIARLRDFLIVSSFGIANVPFYVGQQTT